MKRCPQCRRDYTDETLNFCLDDGAALLDGPASFDDSPTAVLHTTEPQSEADTRPQLTFTDPKTILPLGVTDFSKRGIDKRLLFVPLLILLAAGAFAVYKYEPFESSKIEFSLANAKITKLTTSGKASRVAISPDGKYVVHVQNDGGQQSLVIRQVNTQSNVQIVPPAPVQYFFLKFSPSGDHIYYTVFDYTNYSKPNLFKLPTLGGQPQKIKEDIQGHFSFSPDGSKFVYNRNIEDKTYQMFISNADGTGDEKILETTSPDALDSVAWSPDGERIVYETFGSATGSQLFEMRLSDHTSRKITDKTWCCGMGGVTWTNDGGSLLLWGRATQTPGQIWQLSYPGGEAKQLTNDPEGFTSALSITADSSALVTVKSATTGRMWVGPSDKPGDAQPITSGAGKFDDNPSWSPNGRILFASGSTENVTLFSMNADGSDLRELRSGGENLSNPVVSPDGSSIAYSQRRGYSVDLWIMKADGSEPRQLTSGDDSMWNVPTCFSPDGKWIFFNRWGVTDIYTYKIAADGSGDSIKLHDKISFETQVSPDGKFVAYFYKEDARAPGRFAIAPIDGGEPVKTFPACASCGGLRWSPDGHSLVYASISPNGVGNLMTQPITGGEPKQITDFKSDLIFAFAFSCDGKQIALSRGATASDVLLYTGIK
jgi:TolB protein